MNSLSKDKMLKTIQQGIGRTNQPKKIIIVGAGMAGLVAGSLLKEAGHEVEIIEATSRVGGRVYTKREPFTDGLYLDVGAMRIPNIHDLVFAYVEKFGLTVHPFINASPKDIIFVNGVRTTFETYMKKPGILKYPLAPSERGKNVNELLKEVVGPLLSFISKNPEKNWPIAVQRFEKYSVDDYFRENPFGISLSEGANEMMKVMQMIEGFPELSFIEILRELMILFNEEIEFYEIAGGNDLLPKAFLPELRENIHFQRQMTKIMQSDQGVDITCIHPQTKASYHFKGDYAIITVPFSVLQFVEIEPLHSFSHNKRKAIRELHYVTSTKIGLQFKRRFWEEEGIFGGRMITDLPTRFSYFPSHHLGSKGPGVILASYTWEDDAAPWESLTEEQQIMNALETVSTVYGEKIKRDFVTGYTHNWGRYPYSGGCFTIFKPWQELELSPYIASPEGRVHFAGEHTDLPHGWIETAIKSGIRVAYEVDERQ